MFGMPKIPGLPNPKGLTTSGLSALISFGGAFAINRVFGDRWGIFNQFGVPVLLADNVTSVEYRNTSTVVSAPIEKGSFASYNKVADPYTATVQMTKGGGSSTQRGLFIAQLEALSKSTLLFNVLTPDYVHRNASIVGFGYKRQHNDGARIIIANINLEEVRERSVQFATEATANPQDSSSVDGGEVQAAPAGESFLSSAWRRIGDTVKRVQSGVSGAVGGLQ